MTGFSGRGPWLALLAACTVLALSAASARAALPSFAEVKADWRPSEARLLDRHGELLHELRVDHRIRRGDWTALEDISPALLAAVLRAEDKRFLAHGGVDWLAAGKAALTNWLNDKPRGASTISMQLAALLDARHRAASGRRDVGEKWRQMGAGRELEKAWQKAEILEAYFNLLPLRGELTGIDAAARGLFDKRPAGLGATEAMILAALIRSPNARPADVARRVCAQAAGDKGLPDCASLRARTLNALSGRHPIMPAANLAPHLAQRLLVPGGADQPPRELRSSLDAGLQRHVRTALAEQLAFLAERGARDAAALVLDNASGEVLAYVSLSARASNSPHSDGVRAPRQAGSTLKPFLYAQAFERRLLTAASPLDDTPLAIATAGGEYAPGNYDHAYRGLVSARVALAGSLNIPAVRTLRLLGLEPFVTRLHALGFGGLDEAADWYGYALALGGLDVRLEELTNAYRALANGGLYGPIRFLPGGQAATGERLIAPAAAWLVGDILADRQARAVTFGLENPLATRMWTAVKTGTSKDMRDNWAVGFSETYTVGVWVGNFDGEAMRDVSGISGAAPAWAAIMQGLHAQRPSAPPAPPRGLHRHGIAPPGEAPRLEWFLPGTAPAGTTWRAATPPAEIVSPADGAILALDPDIPPQRQQLRFAARHAPADAVWKLNGEPFAAPAWPLQRGRQALALHDAEGRELHRIEFEVR